MMKNWKTKIISSVILILSIQLTSLAKVTVTISSNTSGVTFTNPINFTIGSTNKITNYVDLTISGLGSGEYITLTKNPEGIRHPLNNGTNDRDVTGDTSRLMILDRSASPFVSLISKDFTSSTTAIALEFTAYPNLIGSFTERIAAVYSGSGNIIAFMDFEINVTATTTTITSLVSRGISLYPNPSISGNINLEDKNNSILSYTLQSLSGDLVATNSVTATMSRIENLKSGMYIIRLNLIDGTALHEKIIVQ